MNKFRVDSQCLSCLPSSVSCLLRCIYIVNMDQLAHLTVLRCRRPILLCVQAAPAKTGPEPSGWSSAFQVGCESYVQLAAEVVLLYTRGSLQLGET